MSSSWKRLEDYVRGIAAMRWNAPCNAEHIHGVDFDGVVKVSTDELIIIEITEERSLDKVRRDINKIVPTKLKLLSEGVMCRGFLVIDGDPTPGMVEAGRAQHITVCSSKEFESSFFDFSSYDSLRVFLPFGSAVDSKTGENDPREFVPVDYYLQGGGKVKVSDLVSKLLRGSRIVLTGEYGAGKSRCVREVYAELSNKIREAGGFPVAINLRDHWSSSNALEILAGHLGNVGLSSSVDNFIRLLNCGSLVLLLDGFDEIGAQSYDVRVDDRISLRRNAVRGVRDLVQKSKAGVLLTGRSHFFDSDEEMLQSLGLFNQRDDVNLVGVPDRFTREEGLSYFKSLGIKSDIPSWLPRKPLVFQLLAELDKSDVDRILAKKHGQFEFWGAFVNAACLRESRGVDHSIAPQTIRQILYSLADKSRYSTSFLGRLSPKDIDEAYERAVGTTPDQTGLQLLSRMCTLARIEPESPDRQFVDASVVDVLRGEKLVADVVAMSAEHARSQWRQSLSYLGAVHAASMVQAYDLEQVFLSYLRKHGSIYNARLLGEVVSALSIFGSGKVDFQALQLCGAEVPIVNLEGRALCNLVLKESIVGLLVLRNSLVSEGDGFVIEDSLITKASGVSDLSGLPSWIKNTEVIDFEKVSNSSLIKESFLSASQKLFLSVVHKIFFQPGAGREEAALLKGGYGQGSNRKLVGDILKILLREGVVEKFKGRDGWVYKPVRRHTERMSRIKSEMTLSEDTLWVRVSSLDA